MGLCSVAVWCKPFRQLHGCKWLCLRHSYPIDEVHPTARRTTVMHGGKSAADAAPMTNGKTSGGCATFAERGPQNLSRNVALVEVAERGTHHGNLLAHLVQLRTPHVLKTQTYTLVVVVTPAWPWKTPFLMSTQEIKVMHDMLRTIPPGELEDV